MLPRENFDKNGAMWCNLSVPKYAFTQLKINKGLTSWLSFVVSSVSLSLSHWYPGSGVVLDCIDS